MIRLPGKAIVYKDFKASFWFIPIFFVELLLVYSWDFIRDNDVGLEIGSFYDSRTIIALLILSLTMLFMSAVLFHHEKSFTYHTLSASMPFSKSEIIISKWFVGMYNIAISFSAYYVVLNCILIRNYVWKRFIADVTMWYITSMFISILIFGLMLMFHSASGSTRLGGFITFLCVTAPVTLLSVIYWIGCRYFLYNELVPNIIDGQMLKIFGIDFTRVFSLF